MEPKLFWAPDQRNAGGAVTDELLKDAQAFLGHTLPLEMVTLLKAQNGGATRGFIHPMNARTSWSDDHVPFDKMAGIEATVLGIQPQSSLMDSAHLSQEWGLPLHQLLLTGEGHYWVSLDYRQGEEPTVAWLDMDCGQDFQIAHSFRDFLNGLRVATP